MVNFPSNISSTVREFCHECKTGKEVVKKLKQNTPLLIDFFKSISNDSTWMMANETLVKKVVSYIYKTCSEKGELSLEQRQNIAAIAKEKLKDHSYENLLNQFVTLRVNDKGVDVEVEINKFLLTVSPVFVMLLQSFEEKSGSISCAMNLEEANALKEFLETGKITGLKDVNMVSLIDISCSYELPLLTEYLELNPVITNNNIFDLIKLSYVHDLSKLLELCLKSLNNSTNESPVFLGVSGIVNVIRINIKGSLENLDPFKHIFDFFIDVAQMVDLKFSVYVSDVTLSKDFDCNNFFHLFPRATGINFYNVTGVTDRTIEALCTNCPHLQWLALESTEVQVPDYLTHKSLNALSRLKNLTSLTLSNQLKLTHDDLRRLPNLKKSKKFKW